MPSKKKRIVVAGFMTTVPIAGVVWQHIHYILGLKQLGYDPIYIEDTARMPYDPFTFESGEPAIRRAVRIMKHLGDRFEFDWVYRVRFTDPMQTYGSLPENQIAKTFANSAATFNLCGAQEMHEDVLKSRCLVYVESDPGVEQIKYDKKSEDTIAYLGHHHAHFTFGENLGKSDCPLPTGKFKWHATRQPVVIDLWQGNAADLDPRKATALIPPKSKGPSFRFTTIANWETKGKDISWKGQIYYWSKTFEFLKFTDLPRYLHSQPVVWEMAVDMSRDPASKELYERQGWRLMSPHAISCNYDDYIRYIRRSAAEWTVAKDQYVRLKTGWFSDRSACYLAAGRPVITQDTLFGKFIPTGSGLFAFQNVDDIADAVETITGHYEKQSRKAAEIAREYFAAEKVIGAMLKTLGL
jgi:hypothetical protein